MVEWSHLRSSGKRSIGKCVFVSHGNTEIFTIAMWIDKRPEAILIPNMTPFKQIWQNTSLALAHLKAGEYVIGFICIFMSATFKLLPANMTPQERTPISTTQLCLDEEAEFMFPLNWQQHTVSTGQFTVPWSVMRWFGFWVWFPSNV